ncbi:hypothetical protein JQ628_18715 [Bradyrhizobium lablabi]|uniref:hypothetical protein n=1 Tax=Bradyrhizobium lablabi TaxID=722472 RepID=UPI001BA5E9C2|nr:hypothetical protein [Bradyrhizobium lablabi]MBR1123564.1 hypothetical protein [Bradyrhizobium lablabi]
MTNSFEMNLARLQNINMSVAADDIPDAHGTASVIVSFADGTTLKTAYWRLIQDGRVVLSSFDHQQKYGLPAPINAKEQVSRLLKRKVCSHVRFDRETADLILIFSETTRFEVFSFTGYEIWTILFPDGTGQYSNHALG